MKEAQHRLTQSFPQLETKYETSYQILWCVMKSQPVPAFTLQLLQDIRTIQDTVAEINYAKPQYAPKYIIWLSDNPEIFSLGWDIQYVTDLIIQKDYATLDQYLQSCIDVFYINLMKLDVMPLITIALVRGKAYGGGFEAALSCDVIITEENARCCFPEIRYHMLPSLGTLKMLLRRIPNPILAADLFEGKFIRLNLFKEAGLIDEITPLGQGIEKIHSFIKKIHHKHMIFAAIYKAKQQNNIITLDELNEFKQHWLNTAKNLRFRDVRRLERIAKTQMRYVQTKNHEIAEDFNFLMAIK